MAESITKQTAVKRFFKANTDQRLGADAIPVVIENFNRIATEIVRKAEVLSKTDDRTTIMKRDVEEAFLTIGGGIENTPQGLFKAIEKLEPEAIGQIALLIADWVKEHRIKLSIGD